MAGDQSGDGATCAFLVVGTRQLPPIVAVKEAGCPPDPLADFTGRRRGGSPARSPRGWPVGYKMSGGGDLLWMSSLCPVSPWGSVPEGSQQLR